MLNVNNIDKYCSYNGWAKDPPARTPASKNWWSDTDSQISIGTSFSTMPFLWTQLEQTGIQPKLYQIQNSSWSIVCSSVRFIWFLVSLIVLDYGMTFLPPPK